MSTVDIVVVTHNSGDLLVECVESTLASTIPVRVIVVDNASCDGSIEKLQATVGNDSGLLILRNPSNLGFATAVNRGLASSNADYILVLNPDCLIKADTLALMLARMAARPEVGMAGCLIRNSDGTEQVGCRRDVPTPWRALGRVLHSKRRGFDLAGRPLPEKPIAVDAISGAFMLLRASAVRRVGPMDEGYFLHCEDLDWCYRFNQAGFGILFIPDVEIWHAKGASSAGRPVFVERHKHAGMLRFYRKFFRNRYPALLWWLVWIAVWARFCLKAGWISLRRLAGSANG